MRIPRRRASLIGGLTVLAPILVAASAVGSSPQARTIAIPAAHLGAFPAPAGTGSQPAGTGSQDLPKPSGLTPPGTGAATIEPQLEPASTPAHPTVLGDVARILADVAYAPAAAPIQVKRAIWAGNAIRLKPYIYAGGHGRWNDAGYDCSGSVSYVLHAAGLLRVSKDSSGFEGWGTSGLGHWITVYTNPGHAFVEIAGVRLDTSTAGDPNPPPGTGPRWRPVMRETAGFLARHPAGL